ncbi:hypothetical protein MTY59_18630 [Mycobacterium senriense]|uniref:Mycobacterium membrane protein n=1 Tax=Mycobacterium senriense TaxID=2775496 RepID=A0ABN6IGM5_9MYCO|nr:hypothetical protein MTY59_18630 [Mycobacterium senriense]
MIPAGQRAQRRSRGLRRAAGSIAALAAISISALINPSTARADESVTYEVVSDVITVANIEYEDSSGRVAIPNVPLPWRIDATIASVKAPPPSGSQVRADWRPTAGPSKWVSARIFYQGKLLCQNTLDVGDAACYGITPRIT